MTRLFYSFRRDVESHATRDLVRRIRDEGLFPVDVVECRGPTGYPDALRERWGREDLVIMEHDMIPTLEQLRTIWDCGHDWCAFAYPLYEGTTGIPGEVLWAHRVWENFEHKARWIREGETQADQTGFGLTRIGLRAQRAVPVPQVWWRSVDHFWGIAAYRAGFRASIHWPAVEHDHKTRVNPEY